MRCGMRSGSGGQRCSCVDVSEADCSNSNNNALGQVKQAGGVGAYNPRELAG